MGRQPFVESPYESLGRKDSDTTPYRVPWHITDLEKYTMSSWLKYIKVIVKTIRPPSSRITKFSLTRSILYERTRTQRLDGGRDHNPFKELERLSQTGRNFIYIKLMNIAL